MAEVTFRGEHLCYNSMTKLLLQVIAKPLKSRIVRRRWEHGIHPAHGGDDLIAVLCVA
jgi:hypothetical protein